MARVHYVKSAQQRFVTVPVLDEAGKPVRNEINRTTRRTGRTVQVTKVQVDRTQPKPNLKCEKCGKEIEPGMPYKWVAPKSGPYGGAKRVRCGTCPSWQVWELSNSLSARLAQVSHDFWRALDNVTDPDDVQTALDEAAQAVRDIAEEKRESAQNIEEGFGHPTSQSEELNDVAEQLDGWADDIETATIPELPEPDDEAGEITEEQYDEWRGELQGDLTIVDESPV